MTTTLEDLHQTWREKWPEALRCWSRYVKLSEPRWCVDAEGEKREGLSGSFAMIRLTDHAVVVSLPQIQQNKLESFATEILAHEIGIMFFALADLLDNARLLARIRRGLPTREAYAPMISNLYTDLLINDRLQRVCELRMAEIYKILQTNEGNAAPENRLWTLYLRIYEVLWSLPKNHLAQGEIDEALDADAVLGARLIRSYAHEWLQGGGRFAMLCLPYMIEDSPQYGGRMAVWLDAMNSGGGEAPDGLAEIEEDELEGAIHPALDPKLSGLKDDDSPIGSSRGRGRGSTEKDMRYREPVEYGAILKALGSKLTDEEIAIKYYRERARPHLIRFPEKAAPLSKEPQMEGLEEWTVGSPLEKIDWLQSSIYSPHIVPGLTTLQRIWSEVPGDRPETIPLDLYLGVDCSGSMIDPKLQMSHPVLAGAIIALSALRAGAKVKVVLSGEPGQATATEGFSRDETQILRTLTGYLGTGYSFGIHRLAETFQEEPARPVHILIVTDHDIFLMLEQKSAESQAFHSDKTGRGWRIAKECLTLAQGGGTYVLHMDEEVEKPGIARMVEDGWKVHCIQDWPDIIAFARAFVRENYVVGESVRR